MKKISYLLAFLIMVIFITGCAVYPYFMVQKTDIKKIAIVSDISLSYDVAGKIDNVPIAENKEFEKQVVNTLKEEFEEKGYIIGKTVSASIGLYLVGNEYNVIENKESEIKDNIINPPISINEIFNEEDKQKLIILFDYFKTYTKTKKEPNKSIQSAIHIAQKIDSESDVLAVVITRGRHVPLGKSVGIAMLTGVATAVATGGIAASIYPTTFIDQYIYLIKAETGEIIWGSNNLGKGSFKFKAKHFNNLTEQLLLSLPSKQFIPKEPTVKVDDDIYF